MAHQIAKMADGRDAMIFRGATPWHRLGQEVPEEHVRNLDFALESAGLNFEVEKMPHYIQPQGEGGGLIQSGDSYSVVRTDNYKVVGTVGSFWHPLQNHEAFAPLRKVMDDGLALVECGGVLREGKQCWMLVQFDRDQILRVAHERAKKGGDQDEFKRLMDAIENENGGGIMPYGLFFNDHSGKGKARVKETMIRVVCANTLDWSLGQEEGGVSIEVTHHSRVAEDYKEATEKMFGDLVGRYTRLANFREILKQVYLPEEEFNERVLDVAAPVEHLEQKIQRREGNAFTKTSLRKRSEQRQEIRRLWTEGQGHEGSGTAWEAWNGLVEWVDHNDAAYNGRDRLQSVTDGSLNKVKKKSLSNLLDYAAHAN